MNWTMWGISDQRPMTASLKQQQSTSSDIYCAFYWTIRWLNFIYYLIFSFSILTHFQTIFILPLLNHRMTQFHAFSHFFLTFHPYFFTVFNCLKWMNSSFKKLADSSKLNWSRPPLTLCESLMWKRVNFTLHKTII